MQIHGLHKTIYRASSLALSWESSDKQKERIKPYLERYERPVLQWQKLRSAGNSPKLCAEITGISQATYYRYKTHLDNLHKGILPPSKRPKVLRKPRWTETDKDLVLHVRSQNPTYGKAKIAVILKRDYKGKLSESTVGRILKVLMQEKRILPSISAPRVKRKRRFDKGHAKPWQYGMKSTQLGELVQIDHMSVSKNQRSFKQFSAWDPLSKYMHSNVYSNATSRTAKQFLIELIDKTPFKIISIQVDGGSEFMKDFENACEKLDIKLFVLPPRRPQWNGGVERSNRIFREEFYGKQLFLADSIATIRRDLQSALHKYNSYRPHKNLMGLTPLLYINNTLLEVKNFSHI